MRRMTPTLGFVIVLLMALAGASGPRVALIHAQDGGGLADDCAALIAGAPAAAAQACGEAGPGQACLGSLSAAAWAGGSPSPDFAKPGDTLALAAIESLTTGAADPTAGTWGLALVKLSAGLPDGQAVTGVLFGEATLARPAAAATDRPTLTVTNASSADANLRGGAGTHFPVVGVLAGGESAVADGRNEQGDWIRIRTADGVAWVFARLVNWEGDLSTLDVLLPTDMTSPVEAVEPFAALTLTTGSAAADVPACSAPSGFLVQYSGEAEAELAVNGAALRFGDATLLLHATPGEALDVIAVDGAVTVTARGVPVTLRGGERTRVPLGGADGLAASGQPGQAQSFALAEVTGAPLALLPGALDCRVSARASNVTLRVGPGENRGALASMRPNATYAVLGWAPDAEGAPWWELDTGAQTSWVRQDAVEAFGACDAVAQVEPPPMIFAPPAAPPPGAPGAVEDTVDDLAPASNTVWQMYPGTDQMSGECSGAPAINFCDHLAAISPASGGIMWKGMEISPYYLQRIQPNVYAYSGPNVLGTGTISITLRFTSEGTLTMTQTLRLSSEPNCTHTYYYTGTKNW